MLKSVTDSDVLNFILNKIGRLHFPGSARYWEKRYASGNNSGNGSYGRLAKHKAEIINSFVKNNKIKSIIEFGCGDGNQLSLAKYPKYIGLDVSITAIGMCINKFKENKKYSFYLYNGKALADNAGVFKGDLSLSLDVIFHLIEDSVFERYMHDLFNSSNKFVIIYSSNTNDNFSTKGVHVKHRLFSEWVDKNVSGWKIYKTITNKFPLKNDDRYGSFSDFYIYKKI